MSPAAKKKQPEPIGDLRMSWSVVGPVLWAVGVYAIAVAIYGLRVNPLWVVATAAGFALLAPVVIAKPLAGRWFAALLMLAIGTYVTWCATGTPFSRNAGLALIPGTAAFGAWWHWIVTTTDHEAEAAQAQASRIERDVARQDLPRILANCGFKGITGGPVEAFEAGRKQTLTLPANGSISYKSLHAATDKIEIAARAKFPIRFIPGETKAEVVAIMLERDVLAETLPYPIDRAAKSIHDPIPLGKDELGAIQVVTMRELSGLFVGERGTGKSGLINSHLAHLTGCKDALVWMIDGKGGRTARPWLEPFLEGIGKPALDWCAIDDSEVDAMILAARAVIDIRSRGKGEKVHPSPQQPAIILIVEEASLVTGTGDGANAKRAGLMKQVIVLGRSEAVDGILVGQRGTVTMIGSGDMKSQLQYLVGLGISKMEDAVRLFGNATMAREALRYAGDDRYIGVMLAKAKGWTSVLPVKGWLLAIELIYGVALTNAQHRPDLEEATAVWLDVVLEKAGYKGGYSGRWDRFRAALAGTARGAVAAVPGGPSHGDGGTPGGAPDGASQRRVPNPDGKTTAERLGLPESPLVDGTKKAAQEKRDAAAFEQLTAGLWDSERDSWADDPADVGEYPEAERDADVIPPILRHVLRLFEAVAADQLHTKTILEADVFAGQMTAKRLGILMNHCGVTSKENLIVDGERARGYTRLDVARAFTKARDSGAPEAAFDWEP